MPGFENRRRSGRLLIAIPVHVQGTSPQGKVLNQSTRTVEINRHGARIVLKGEVIPGTVLQIANPLSRAQAPFRALRLEKASAREGEGGEWAVECLDDRQNVWGVQFPP